MKVLDNKVNKFGDDIKEELKVGDKCNIASAVFSMYSYQELKNKLNGKSIAKECANWIKDKAKFKSNINNNPIQKFMNINDRVTYLNVDEFSSAGLGYQKNNTIFMKE